MRTVTLGAGAGWGRRGLARAFATGALLSSLVPVVGAAPAESPNLARPQSPNPPPEPWDLPIGKPQELAIARDKPVRVAHAPQGVTTTIVYLHGMCGNPRGADPWIDLATRYGTVVTLKANVPCGDRPGFKWPHEPEAIQERIDAALDAVARQRHGQLDTAKIVLLGYSQGAHRAERLAAAFPHRYPTLMLGGPPTTATPERLRHAQRVAIVGGELEDTRHMMDGYLALRSAGLESEFFLLPRAHHGSYGPKGRVVMDQVLAFLFEALPERATRTRLRGCSPHRLC